MHSRLLGASFVIQFSIIERVGNLLVIFLPIIKQLIQASLTMSKNIIMNEIHFGWTTVFVQGPTAVGAGALKIMQLVHLLEGGFGFSGIPRIV